MAPPQTLCELAWPANLIGAVLETTTDVGTTANWTSVPNAITTTDTERLYFQPMASGDPQRFYRLPRAIADFKTLSAFQPRRAARR
jgi:hypothetical protein